MTKIKSPEQLDQAIIIHASIDKAWNMFNDLSLRPKWTCDVQQINYTHQMATVGETAVTTCIVNGKRGTIETRCLALDPKRRGEFSIDKDTFGMSKALSQMSFATEFLFLNANTTEVRMLSHYRPKNFIIKIMNKFIKKKMAKEVNLMLIGLKNFIETGQTNQLNPINQ